MRRITVFGHVTLDGVIVGTRVALRLVDVKASPTGVVVATYFRGSE
jgi:hypothetical protein